MHIIRCLVCSNEYSSANSLYCPKCNYPGLSLSEKPDLHRLYVSIYRNNHASEGEPKKYGPTKNKQIKCVICSSKYMLSELHCPKCRYPAISFTKQLNKYEGISSLYRKKRINTQRVILDRTLSTQELDSFVNHYSEEIQQEIIIGYKEFANNGNPYAQFNLGMLYYFGHGIEKDRAAAKSLFRKAALAGITEAQYMRGLMLLDNSQAISGKEWLEKEGAQWMEKAANSDHPAAQYYLGKLFLEGKVLAQDYKKAAIWFIKAAAKGNKEAAYELSILFREGKGVHKDNSKADKYYKRALELGYTEPSKKQQKRSDTQKIAEDYYNRGEAYYYGRGVEKNYKRAEEWYRKAAVRGYKYAYMRLGELYERGLGVEQNKTIATVWYQKAAECWLYGAAERLASLNNAKNENNSFKNNAKSIKQNNSSTQKTAEDQYNRGDAFYYGLGVDKNYKRAAEWYRKAAEQGHAAAQNKLGHLYEKGIGVGQDFRKAAEWYQKAAEKEYPDAQKKLGDLYKYGNGVEKNFTKAEEWYHKASDQGNSLAQFSLGHLYEDDLKAYTKAAEWYRKSAEQECPPAQRCLGELYEHGKGVEKDRKKAEEWYRKAAAHGDKAAADKLTELNKRRKGILSIFGL